MQIFLNIQKRKPIFHQLPPCYSRLFRNRFGRDLSGGMAAGDSPTKQRGRHIDIALQAADNLTRRVQAGNGFLCGGKHLHVIINMQAAQGSIVAHIYAQRVIGAFLTQQGVELSSEGVGLAGSISLIKRLRSGGNRLIGQIHL